MTAPGAPNEQADSVTLSTFAGLNNVVTAERLKPDELAIAENIDIDAAGQVRRRRGYTLAASGQWHSLWAAPSGKVWAVKDGILGNVFPDASFSTVYAGIGDRQVSYVEVNGVTYFSTLATSGKVLADGSVAAWAGAAGPRTWLSPVVNESATLPASRGKLLRPPPLASALAHYHGRIYCANGSTLWATQLYLYDYMDATRNFLPFEADITLLVAMDNGLYVGTEQGMHFLSGVFPEMKRDAVMPGRVVPRSAVMVPADVVTKPYRDSRPTASKWAVLFMTDLGVCVGFDSGVCYNMTDERLVLPPARDAAVLYRQQDGIDQYLAVADSGGTPMSTARIGDFVDAEIRRFQGA